MITFDNFSGASLSFLMVNIFVVALLGVMILAAYRRRIRALMRGGDAIAVNLPPEKTGRSSIALQYHHNPTNRACVNSTVQYCVWRLGH